MSKRLATREHRCSRCQIDIELCFCEKLKALENRTPVVVVMHWREQWLTSNSTNIAIQSLSNIETVFRGMKDRKKVEIDQKIYDDFTPLYLFPSDDAVELSSEFLGSLNKPPALIVPDGTWSQTRKFYKREEALKNLIHVKLPFTGESKYYLRKAHFEGGLSTLESIARALGIIEDQSIQKDLEAMLQMMVERVMLTRGGEKDIFRRC